MEKQFRDMMGNDSLPFLGDVELVVKRKEQASEFIERIRSKVEMETSKDVKENDGPTKTESGLKEGRERSKYSFALSRQRAKSEVLHGMNGSVQERSLRGSERNVVSCASPYTSVPRPFEPKRFTPLIVKSRVGTGPRNMVRSRVRSKQFNLNIEVKTVRSSSENSRKLEEGTKYFASEPLGSSPEPSMEVLGNLNLESMTLKHKSGTLESYYRQTNAKQNSLNFVFGQNLINESFSKTTSRHRQDPEDNPNTNRLLFLLHDKKQKNMAQVFDRKLQEIRGNRMTRTYN